MKKRTKFPKTKLRYIGFEVLPGQTTEYYLPGCDAV
jgi:hypothetical protein